MALTIDNPFAAPPGSYPPATTRWYYFCDTSTPDVNPSWRVPFQPGTPLGILVPIVWQVSDIFFRQEQAGSSNSTLRIQRYTGNAAFSAPTNLINDTPVVILAGAYEQSISPLTGSIVDNPLVNSGDKLSLELIAGTGTAGWSFYVTLVQQPGT
jgi:hypothetical protein